jgi:hypothetical protein
MSEPTPVIDTSPDRLSGSDGNSPKKTAKADSTRAKDAAREANTKASQAEDDEEEVEDAGPSFLTRFFADSASWMTSLVVHMVAIIILALSFFTLPQTLTTSLSALQSDEINDELEDMPLVDFEALDIDITPEEVQPDTPNIEDIVSESIADDLESAPESVIVADLGDIAAPDFTDSAAGFDGSALSGRGHAARQALVRKGGGSAASEEAVALALSWLAEHQNPDGTWHLDHTGGKCQGRCGDPGTLKDSTISGTALALLPFLGAGQTHTEGKYKQVVGKGLDALVKLGKKTPNGVSWEDGGTMYAHGITAIALCEAYGMTKDTRLYAPAQAAIDYIVYAQSPEDGGWRYRPRTPGDTSVVGWQVMALKSAHLAFLRVPNSTVQGASKFLDLAQMDYGSAYAYMTENKNNYRAGTSAVGLLCRMYLGWKRDDQRLQDGAARLAKIGPSQGDYYYNYYASQVLFQMTGGTGPEWKKWNDKLRDQLVATQSKKDHEKGSWYVRGPHNDSGGRLYCTAMACMNLEVYYRHMPIYRTDAVDKEFPE